MGMYEGRYLYEGLGSEDGDENALTKLLARVSRVRRCLRGGGDLQGKDGGNSGVETFEFTPQTFLHAKVTTAAWKLTQKNG